ncbi:MAG: hypothetical protein L0L39_05835 [Atopostipes suicloacalis]|nr:hypothetical protein [Atopostipes suicloacalis]
MAKEINSKSLKKFNGIMGFLHLFQAFLMLGFALFIDKIANFEVPFALIF